MALFSNFIGFMAFFESNIFKMARDCLDSYLGNQGYLRFGYFIFNFLFHDFFVF